MTDFKYSDLDPVFNPKSIAIVGASERRGSIGRTLTENLFQGKFEGKTYLINPKGGVILGHVAHQSLSEVKEKIDLVVVITPATTVPGIIQEAVNHGIKAAIIISAGFKEVGEEGERLEKEVVAIAKSGGMRIIGPNCLGVMNPLIHMNATFADAMGLKGNIAFISQSGAMCTAVLDWSLKEKIGFSAFVSIGSMADIHWGDLIEYLGKDKNTKSILIYMEAIGDANAFITAARKVALLKPIVVIKAGRSEAAAAAAASHTGSLAGSDGAFDAAMEKAGVLRVDTMSELFDVALMLAKQPLPKGPNLTIITNAGGPGVLATDATVLSGAAMGEVSEGSLEKLSAFLPPFWSHSNPVDILGGASPDEYGKALEILTRDPSVDGILTILSPQSVTEPTETAQKLIPHAKTSTKPLIASWMGGDGVSEGSRLLNDAGIPTFPFPDQAAKVFGMLWKYSQDVKAMFEMSASASTSSHPLTSQKEVVSSIIHKAQKEKRDLLTEEESKRVLKAYGIPVVETVIATSAKEAAHAADTLGYPIVVKLHSKIITHKTEAGGVKLNLKSAADVEIAYHDVEKSAIAYGGKEAFLGVTVQKMIQLSKGYELILGSTTDPQFGPVILFGTGGQLVEVYKDSALSLPPLNGELARHLMAKTKVYEALKGVRGMSGVDMHLLEQIVVRFSNLITNHSEILECDINPLHISSEGGVALDARVLLRPQH